MDFLRHPSTVAVMAHAVIVGALIGRVLMKRPATGAMLIPYGTPPAGGGPVGVWAHGTSSVGRSSAPSLMQELRGG